MTAETEIANLLYSYAEFMDCGDFAGAADLFRHARLRVGGEGGPDGAGTVDSDTMLSLWRGMVIVYPDGTPRTKHVITNPIIEAGPDGTARCRSYYTVLQKAGDAPLRPIITGRYQDEFEKVDGEWRFSRRHMGIDQIGDVSLHLLIDLG